jgi:hypothetical protein
LLCSVILTVVLSTNSRRARARAVTTVSFISTAVLTVLGVDFLLRTISVGPVCSTTLPTPAQLVGLNNIDSIKIAGTVNNHTVI